MTLCGQENRRLSRFFLRFPKGDTKNAVCVPKSVPTNGVPKRAACRSKKRRRCMHLASKNAIG
jgi:hypothetical protein